jgi:hypothetical protein
MSSLPRYSHKDEEAQPLVDRRESEDGIAPPYNDHPASGFLRGGGGGEASGDGERTGEDGLARRTVMYIFQPTYMVEGEEERVISAFGETRLVSPPTIGQVICAARLTPCRKPSRLLAAPFQCSMTMRTNGS